MKLHSVGIKNFICPVSIREQSGSRQRTVATISLQAAMPRQLRGTCVGIFTTILARYRQDIHASIFPKLLAEVQTELAADKAQIRMVFPYFIEKKAPVTTTTSLMEYECSFTGALDTRREMLLQVVVPVTTLCPCSKEISQAGAHNQRAEITLTVQPNRFIWLEELIRLVESCASCEVYSLLKRPDEKFVTEKAYATPMFVEDVVRVVAQKALDHPAIKWFSVGVESFESIHKHSAYAFVDSEDLHQKSDNPEGKSPGINEQE